MATRCCCSLRHRSQKAPSSRGKKTQSSSKVPEAKKGPKTQTKSQKGTKSRSGTSTADMLKAEGVKRARSAYIFFGMEERSKVLAESPGLSIGEVAKALGERWQALGPEHKAKVRVGEDVAKAGREVAKVLAYRTDSFVRFTYTPARLPTTTYYYLLR